MIIKPIRYNQDVVLEIKGIPIFHKNTNAALDSITLDVYGAKILAYSILTITSHIEEDEQRTAKSILSDLQKIRFGLGKT